MDKHQRNVNGDLFIYLMVKGQRSIKYKIDKMDR